MRYEYIFWQNSLFHSSKKCFYIIFDSFWKIEFCRKIDRHGPYKNGENFVLSQNVLRKYSFGKIICSTHQKKCFYKILVIFWIIEFLTENRQHWILQKWLKFCSFSKCAKKIFLAKSFVSLIKRSVSTKF